jgi:hypothetical protein
MDSGTDDNSALANVLQGPRNQVSDRGEQDCRIEKAWRLLVAGSGPRCPQAPGKFLRRRIAFARERKDFASFVARELGDDVRGRTESIDSHAASGAGGPQRPVADEPRTEQRRGLGIRIHGRQAEAKSRIGNHIFGITPVHRIAGKTGAFAQILATVQTIAAFTACPRQPRNPYPLPQFERVDPGTKRGYSADNLVAWNDMSFRIGQIAIDNVKVGPADSASRHFYQYLTIPRNGRIQHTQCQRLPRRIELHCTHGRSCQARSRDCTSTRADRLIAAAQG